MTKIKEGILNIILPGNIYQKWLIIETKRHTHIIIIDKENKIIGWNKYPLMNWWLKK